MKKVLILLFAAILILTACGITALADDADDGNPQGPPDKEEKKAARMEKWEANKARIAAKKDELAARKEAFFALKDQTKEQVAEQKALIKEQKAFIIEQVHLLGELDQSEKKALKADIKMLWQGVRDTQRYLWQIRQAAGEQAREILGKVEVAEPGGDAPNLDVILTQI